MRQVVAACHAAKLAVLCEKPLALSHIEAEQISAAAAASGTNVMVGAMHVYDPAYRAAYRAWVEQDDVAVFAQSSIFLPSNDCFTVLASEPGSPPPPPASGEGFSDAVMLRDAVLGLAIHNLPLLRQFHPRLGELASACFIRPFGYSIVVGDDNQTLELLGYMGGTWPPNWALRTVGRGCELRVMFTPSFVLAGSSRAELVTADSTWVFEFDTNGYQCECAVEMVSASDPANVERLCSDATRAIVVDQTWATGEPRAGGHRGGRGSAQLHRGAGPSLRTPRRGGG